MRRVWTKLAIVIAAVFTVAATPAMAQATRTWVSGVGDDVNPCSRTAPCKTFAGAISKTAAGGEINCLDPGGFGTLTITKSITIDCTGTFGSTLNSGAINGFVVNDSATAAPGTIKVTLNGLEINGAGTGLNGVRMISGRDVVISNTNIRNQSGAGVSIAGSASISLTMKNTTISGTAVGVDVANTGGTGKARIFNSLIVDSSTAGIRVTNPNNTAEISGNQIVRGTALQILSGGVINSYGDNVLTGGNAPTIIPKG